MPSASYGCGRRAGRCHRMSKPRMFELKKRSGIRIGSVCSSGPLCSALMNPRLTVERQDPAARSYGTSSRTPGCAGSARRRPILRNPVKSWPVRRGSGGLPSVSSYSVDQPTRRRDAVADFLAQVASCLDRVALPVGVEVLLSSEILSWLRRYSCRNSNIRSAGNPNSALRRSSAVCMSCSGCSRYN